VHQLLEETQELPVTRNVISSQYIVVLFGISLSAYALLNTPRTTAGDFDVKTYSVR
jgi:hypothetical protein